MTVETLALHASTQQVRESRMIASGLPTRIVPASFDRHTRRQMEGGKRKALLQPSQPAWREGDGVSVARRVTRVDGGEPRTDDPLLLLVEVVATLVLPTTFWRADAGEHGCHRPIDVARDYLDRWHSSWRADAKLSAGDHVSSELIHREWLQRAAGQVAWITRFTARTIEPPRLMARNPARGYLEPGQGLSLPGAGEAVPEDYQADLSREAFKRDMGRVRAGRSAVADELDEARRKLAERLPSATRAERREMRRVLHVLSNAANFYRSGE